MMIPIVRGGRGLENDDNYHNFYSYYRKEGGGGQRVMIGIIIEVNDDNCGRPLTYLFMA